MTGKFFRYSIPRDKVLEERKGQVPRERKETKRKYIQADKTDRQTQGMREGKIGFDVSSWVVNSTVVKVVKGASSAL